MNVSSDKHKIERRFLERPNGVIRDLEIAKLQTTRELAHQGGLIWAKVLESKRVLLIAEAGSGKTYECKAQAERLIQAGEMAFFVELSGLATTRDLTDLFDWPDIERFEMWKANDSTATFFLDSVDELKLTRLTFKQALNHFKRAIGKALHRVRLVITTRPVLYDEDLIRELLPVLVLDDAVPLTHSNLLNSNSCVGGAGAFADRVLAHEKLQQEQKAKSGQSKKEAPEWRRVTLLPFSEQQIAGFFDQHEVQNSSEFLAALNQQNMLEFAGRPLDLLALIEIWKRDRVLEGWREQLNTLVETKLRPRDSRQESAGLTLEKAREGASRLAWALLMTKSWTIRLGHEFPLKGEGPVLDPEKFLFDWTQQEIRALLERPLFLFASYGQVRFFHRSALEFLAAACLQALRQKGRQFLRVCKQFIFADRGAGQPWLVLPSHRATAAWLAFHDAWVFQRLCCYAPDVLMYEGDPGAFSVEQRVQILKAFVTQYPTGYGHGLLDWSDQRQQVHRLAHADLDLTIQALWGAHKQHAEHTETRILLLELVKAARIKNCATLAFEQACDCSAKDEVRKIAVEALIALEDCKHLTQIVDGLVSNQHEAWPVPLVLGLTPPLFRYLSVSQLLKVLERAGPQQRQIGDVLWHLACDLYRVDVKMSTLHLKDLRDGLVGLVMPSLRWQQQNPTGITSDWACLGGLLAAVCVQEYKQRNNNVLPEWLTASALALRLYEENKQDRQLFECLEDVLCELSTDRRARLFWAWRALSECVQRGESGGGHGNDQAISHLTRSERNGREVDFAFDVRGWQWPFWQIKDLDWVLKQLKEGVRDDQPLQEDEAELLWQFALSLIRRGSLNWTQDVARLWPLAQFKQAWQDELMACEKCWKDGDERREKEHKENIKEAENRAIQQVNVLKDRRLYLENLWPKLQELFAEGVAESAGSSAGRGEGFIALEVEDVHQRWDEFAAVMQNKAQYLQSWNLNWNAERAAEYFGQELVAPIREQLKQYWRAHCLFLLLDDQKELSDRLTSLMGFALSAETSQVGWANALTNDEVQALWRCAQLNINQAWASSWFADLLGVHEEQLRQIFRTRWLPHLNSIENWQDRFWCVPTPESVQRFFMGEFLDFVCENQSFVVDEIQSDAEYQKFGKLLRGFSVVLAKYGDDVLKARLKQLAIERLGESSTKSLPFVWTFEWLRALLLLDVSEGMKAFEECLNAIASDAKHEALLWFKELFPLRLVMPFDVNDCSATDWVSLCRLVVRYVHFEDDVKRVGLFTPELRDDAQSARNQILNFFFHNVKGLEAFEKKKALCADASFLAPSKKMLLQWAENCRANELDSHSFSDREVRSLWESAQAPIQCNAHMFDLMKSRLEDLEEALKSDASPKQSWRFELEKCHLNSPSPPLANHANAQETFMRREIAGWLNRESKGCYSVTQEEVTADEKRTDIRLSVNNSSGLFEAVIELKVAEKGWSVNDLRNTIKTQLVERYLQPYNRQSGALVVTVVSKEQWKHPETEKFLNISQLRELLETEVANVQKTQRETLYNDLRLFVCVLDLTPVG